MYDVKNMGCGVSKLLSQGNQDISTEKNENIVWCGENVQKHSECIVSRGKKIISKVWVVGCLNFCLKVNKIYQMKKWKILFGGGETPQNCQSVQFQGVEIVSKTWVVGCLSFCLKMTKRYQLKKL